MRWDVTSKICFRLFFLMSDSLYWGSIKPGFRYLDREIARSEGLLQTCWLTSRALT